MAHTGPMNPSRHSHTHPGVGSQTGLWAAPVSDGPLRKATSGKAVGFMGLVR